MRRSEFEALISKIRESNQIGEDEAIVDLLVGGVSAGVTGLIPGAVLRQKVNVILDVDNNSRKLRESWFPSCPIPKFDDV